MTRAEYRLERIKVIEMAIRNYDGAHRIDRHPLTMAVAIFNALYPPEGKPDHASEVQPQQWRAPRHSRIINDPDGGMQRPPEVKP